jgi:hypothetical protein
MTEQALLDIQYHVTVIDIYIFSSYAVGTGLFNVLKGRGVAIATHYHLTSRLKKE